MASPSTASAIDVEGVNRRIGFSRNAKLYGPEQGTYPGIFLLDHRMHASGEEDFEEVAMARIIVRCIYTGHYVFTTIDTQTSPTIVAGCVSCPYCGTDHVWTVDQTHIDDLQKKAMIVRQAS